ncbi:MAG: glycine cleavage system protein GcvH [Euryarchaeota archaeon]|jgi:glycine cleavage system H protein|nr:glycine cleavage system protein GcvH [Euryarchaeota archaeon]MBT4407746.1 glycine cleavage system protein GcvH [Euryarchaeota archaeon]
MSEVPEGLYYTKEHEWMRIEGDEIVIGITDHAQNALTDIVYIELPEEGTQLEDMGEFAIVESVKSASPIFAPLAGTITAVNDELEDTPELMNESPYEDGWIIKMTIDNLAALDGMMSSTDYQKMIE